MMSREMQMPDRGSRRRLFFRLFLAGAAVAIWSGLLCARLYELQVERHAELRTQAENQQKGFIEIPPHRGDILDRNLDPLAVSVPVESLFAHPAQVDDPQAAAKALAPLLGMPERHLQGLLGSDKPFVYLARRIPPRKAEQVRRLGLNGVYSHPETRRYYPNRELASHVLGFVGIDGTGLSGLEYLYQKELEGRKARVSVRVDARRRSYDQDDVGDSTRGSTLVLSIDKSLQFIAEQVLRQTVQSRQATSGTAVLMDPHTGAVLAMASYPDFNPNRYRDYDPESYRNRAIRELYEPGSTFKIFSLSAVLNEQLVSLDEEINCRVGSIRLAGKVYREAANHDYGILKFNQVVAKSSNVGTIRLVLRLGESGLYQYMRRLGFGEKTGVDLPGEETGLLRPTERWSRLSIGALSIGQEIGVTALQIVTAVSAVANGGCRVQPHVVERILDPDGRAVWEATSRPQRILSARTTGLMKQALTEVVEIGTGREAALDGYSSAGKTGTAQEIVDGVYSKTLHVPSYVGFAPAADPVLAAVIVIHEPRGEYYASRVAAPAFAQIMERALLHLGVPRDLPVHPRNERSLRSLAAAELQHERGISDEVGEKGQTAPLTAVPADNRQVVLLEENSKDKLPDFTGMSLRQVLGWSNRMGLRLSADGSGVALRQKPSPGSGIFPGMQLEVIFSRRGKGRTDGESSSAQRVADAGSSGGRH